MAAELVTPDVIAAAADRVSFGSNAELHEEAAVVNCAKAAALEPDEQLVFTLQSYNDDAVKPVKLSDVPVWAVEKLVQVDDEFNL